MTQQDPYTITRHDSTNNIVEHRVVTPLPQPTRIQPAAPITKGELVEMIAELRQEMADQQERFDNKDELDAERNQKRSALSTAIAELTQQLREAQGELDQLNREGSIREQFIAFACEAEGRITSIANGTYNFLLEKVAHDRHEASYKELTPLLKEDVKFKVDRLNIRFLTQGSFASLHRTSSEHISDARIEATLNKVFTATETLEKSLK